MNWRIAILGRRYVVDARWWLLAGVMCIGPLFAARWQMARGEYKSTLEDRYFERMAMTPVSCKQAVGRGDNGYVRIRARGVFEAHQYLLDNRTHQGEAGVEVLNVFRCEDGQRLLMNRGWTKDEFAALRQPSATQFEIIGFVSQPFELSPFMSRAPWPDGWPKRVAYLDFERIRLGEGADLPPYSVVLEEGQPQTLAYNFQPQALSPYKNYGYVAQWIAIAIGIVTYLGYRGCQRLN